MANGVVVIYNLFTDNITPVCSELWLPTQAVVVNMVAAAKAIWPFCLRENIIVVLTTATTFVFLPAIGSAALGIVEKGIVGFNRTVIVVPLAISAGVCLFRIARCFAKDISDLLAILMIITEAGLELSRS